MPEPTTIQQNLASIQARIAAAAAAAGRDAAEITLIAVSKTHPQAAVLAALAAGQSVFGENRVQEAAEKFPLAGARLHLIGGLQTNKAAEAVRLADSIDSLDRPKLSDAIAARGGGGRAGAGFAGAGEYRRRGAEIRRGARQTRMTLSELPKAGSGRR